MIRLGSLGGYPFEGPSLLAGWTPPARPGVFAIAYKPDPDAERFAVVYVGHTDDLSTVGFGHPQAPCWVARAGNRFRAYVCTYEVPGGTSAHREQIARELLAVYRPGCNPEQYDQAWNDHWIGSYSAPTAGPLTTPRDLRSDPGSSANA